MRFGLSLIVIASLVGPAAAAAPASAPTQVAPQTITRFARCVVQRHHKEASDYVLLQTGQSAMLAERKLADRACVPRASTREEARDLLKMLKEKKLRPAFAQALVREEFPTFDPRLINTAQPLGYGKLVDELWPADACDKCRSDRLKEFADVRARAASLMAPLVFAECAVRTDPANSHRLLMTEAGSAAENSALDSLQPAFASCVVEGVKFNIGRAAVRDAIALNYYRLAKAPRATGALQ